jgi:hypothetical protein
MVEATGDPTPPPTKTLTAGDIENLADRLLSHGASMMFPGQPMIQSDMRTASQVMRGLLGKIGGAAGAMVDTARLLAEIRIEVQG